MGDRIRTWTLARKNLRRQPRRTRLLLLAVGGGLAVVVWILNFRNDATRQMVGHFLAFNQGHAQIVDADFWRGAHRPPDMTKVFPTPPIKGEWVPRVWVPLLLAGEKLSRSVAIQGLDLRREMRASGLGKLGVDWSELPEGQVVLGAQLARELGVRPGDDVAAIGQGLDGTMIQELLRVWRVVDLGGGEFEAGFGFMALDDARELMCVPGASVHALVTYEEVPEKLRMPAGLLVRPWGDLLPDIQAAASFSDNLTKMTIFFFLLVVALATANTLGLSFRERKAEFRALRVLGASRAWVWRLLSMETIWVLVFGMAAGNLLAMAALTVCHFVPVDMALVTGGGQVFMGGFPVDQNIRTTPEAAVFIGLNLVLPALVLTFVAWPVRRFVRELDS